jgi:hypothetical protein
VTHRNMSTSPVFFLYAMPPRFDVNSIDVRQEADRRMRERFAKFYGKVQVPVLHGVCGIDSPMAFYQMDASTGVISPEKLPGTDFASASWWSGDLSSEEGMAKLKAKTADVLTMCQQVPAPNPT